MSERSPNQSPPVNLGYATPLAKSSGVQATFVLMGTALGLIVLGGCFLMGVMATNAGGGGFGPAPAVPPSLTWAQIFFEAVLYGLAFGCFSGAVYLIGLGIRWMRPKQG